MSNADPTPHDEAMMESMMDALKSLGLEFAVTEDGGLVIDAIDDEPTPPKKRHKPPLKRGEVIRYTGTYGPGVTPYGPGRIAAFRQYRVQVTVELLDDEGKGTGSYADWPTDEVERVL